MIIVTIPRYTQIVVQSELGLTLKPDPGRRVDD